MSTPGTPEPRQEANGASPGPDVSVARDRSAIPVASGDVASLPGEVQFTLRGVLTGMALGALLSVCNIYAALKVGMSPGMSITAAILGYGIWTGLHYASGRRIRAWGILENNINQTACSSGAAVASAGLATAIPALAVLSGKTLPWLPLAYWVFGVCLVGIVVAVGVRRQVIVVDQLPFPVGIASAETLRGIHAKGADALLRVLTLLGGAIAAAGVAVWSHLAVVRPWALWGGWTGKAFQMLGVGVSPMPLLYGVGGLIGFRACVSLLVGALLAFVVIVPWLANAGIVADAHYGTVKNWLVWPGVTMMVFSALVSLAFSWRSVIVAFQSLGGRQARSSPKAADDVSRGVFLGGLLFVLILSVCLQVVLFSILWWAAIIGVLLSFVLALVAARVSGETGITPVASIGKLSQLTLAGLIPQDPVPNVMAANVTGGAASQCADLLHDLKCGQLLGASPRWQTLAQVCGAFAGALFGSAAYLWMMPDPASQLFTERFPAPAALSLKTVATLFKDGFDALPAHAPLAMIVAAVVALVLTVLEKTAPQAVRAWIPSAASMGLAFIFPAYMSMTIFAGGLVSLSLRNVFKTWSARFLITACTGLIVGDTLTSVVLMVIRLT